MSGSNDFTLSLLKGLESSAHRIEAERPLRLDNASRCLSFGVSFLDECLGGIFPNDLIILGAKTGFGKSQLASLIAMHNIKAGKRVHFFALEAEEYEIERRIKYQLIADRFFSLFGNTKPKAPFRLNYMDWYYGKFDQELDQIEKEVEAEFDQFKNLITYYRQREFDIKEFQRITLSIKDETDLMIVDHLHYFDYDDRDENKAVKETVKGIRDLALITGKPVVLVAHVRKSDKKSKQLIPDLEDFHGSSDIGKIATKAITIAPCYDENATTIKRTYFQVLKCRIDGSRAHLTALLAFNTQQHRYERAYYLGKLSQDGTEFNPFKFNEMPDWAKNAAVAQN